MRRVGIFLLIAVMALSLCACAAETEPQEEMPSGILSEFTAADLQGNAVDQTVLKDCKLTMVNVWATYCSPCISEMPDLGTIAQEYAERGVQVIGLVSDAQNADGTVSDSQVQLAADIVAETGADYLHLVPDASLSGLLGQITAVPTTFFVDEAGNQVGGTYLGARSLYDWTDVIDQLLEEVQ